MQLYSCGFLFSRDRKRVLLIRKRRPAWQAGKLNGLGGKIEAAETPLQAMVREFREEAGLTIDDWQEVLTITGADWRGHFFRGFGSIEEAQAITDEQLEIYPVDSLPRDTIPNLHWMVPLLLDHDIEKGSYRIVVHPTRASVALENR
jgi:8-oxo-dGTP diphosphatase